MAKNVKAEVQEVVEKIMTGEMNEEQLDGTLREKGYIKATTFDVITGGVAHDVNHIRAGGWQNKVIGFLGLVPKAGGLGAGIWYGGKSLRLWGQE